MAKNGRPTKFTDDLAKDICNELANGRSLRSYCRQDNTPAMSTVMRWISDDKKFQEQYARARELQADYFVDEIVEIADKAEDAAIARLQVDARKWVAGKQRPKKYSDKIVQQHVGKDDGPIEISDVTPQDKLRKLLDAKSVGTTSEPE